MTGNPAGRPTVGICVDTIRARVRRNAVALTDTRGNDQ